MNAANFGQLVERQVSGKLSNSTEVVEQHEVAPGLYLVVPCMWTPGVEMKFLLRIFTDTETNSRYAHGGWLGRRVVSVLDSGAERARVQIAAATLSGNSLKQTVHTHLPLFTKQQN